MAIEIADVILFMTDIKQGVTEADKEISMLLRKSKKPVVLVCNKSDTFGKVNEGIYEFYNLGIGEPFEVSSVNASGIGDVLDEAYKYFPNESKNDENDDVIKVAIIRKTKCRKIFTC